MNACEPLIVPKHAERLGEALEARIVSGFYPPGTRLDETDLAESFGVSRTPVREALIQLAAAGLIEMRPRRGAMVPEVGADLLCEQFEVMAELEAMAGRLAARRITPAELAGLAAAHEACRAARDEAVHDTYFSLNEAFHHRIYEASHNGFLVEQATALHRRLRPYRRLQMQLRHRPQHSFDEHQAIVDAIGRGDGECAANLLRAHVVVQGERFTDLVAALRSR